MRVLQNRKCVAGYSAVGSEISPTTLLQNVMALGISVCLPYFAHRSAEMQFKAWDPDVALEASPFGFAQPSMASPEIDPDCLLVPMLAYDRQGNRIGQGGGHYDRYLSRFPNSLRIGIAWWQQERIDIVPMPWDVQMNYVATDSAWIDCATMVEGKS